MRWILGAAVVTAREAVTFLAVAFVAVMRKGYSQNNFLLPPRWKEVAGPQVRVLALFGWLPSQPAVLFSYTSSAPATSYQSASSIFLSQ
jgi:hypothetical protein